MKKVWLIGGLVVSCGIAGASACGSSTNTGGSGPGGSAATTTTTGVNTTTTTTTTTGPGGSGVTTTTTTTTGIGGTGGTGSTTGTGGSGNCSAVTTLHPPHLDAGPGTIYCPFSSMGDGGNEYCTAGTEFCCETAKAEAATVPSQCMPIANATNGMCPSAFMSSSATPAGSTVWECEDPVADCTDPAKPVCCAVGYGYPAATAATPSIGLGAPGCGNFANKMGGTVCMAQGQCTGIIMCSNPDNSECPSGQTCMPFSKAGNQVGGCL